MTRAAPPPRPPQRLAAGEWFTARISACGLFAVGYPKASAALKTELRQLYSQLCHDETPMVRRAAAQKLGGFAKAVEQEFVAQELMPLFNDLFQDGARRGAARPPAGLPACSSCLAAAAGAAPAAARRPLLPGAGAQLDRRPCPPPSRRADQDSVRLLAVEASGAFAQSLSKEDCAQQLLPLVQKFAQVSARCRAAALEQAPISPAAGMALQRSPSDCGLAMWGGRSPARCCQPAATQLRPTRPDCRPAPQDKSWRVRFNVANQLVTLCDALGKDVTRWAPARARSSGSRRAGAAAGRGGRPTLPRRRRQAAAGGWRCSMGQPQPGLQQLRCAGARAGAPTAARPCTRPAPQG